MLPVGTVVDYLVERKIVGSRDLAERLFKKMLGCEPSALTYLRLADFTHLFTRSLFRECILHAAKEIDRHQASIISTGKRPDRRDP